MAWHHVLLLVLLQICNAFLAPALHSDPNLQVSTPHLVPLRRESVPVRRKGKIASFKTSYSGVISVGSPKQEFRVVFDTGSGHVVLPALECRTESCLLHRRYKMLASKTAKLVNTDGSEVMAGEYADQATIGFGTGEITGEFVRDVVCLGPVGGNEIVSREGGLDPPCLNVSLIMAIEMSTQPFKSFAFDGILGLGLSGLSLSPAFSFFDKLTKSDDGSKLSPHFAVYLTDAENGQEESEVAIGGHNPKRLLEPLSWSPVARKELGYWQVKIVSIRINGEALEMCKDGSCHGVVDTGSSHLGVPAPHDKHVADMLTVEAGDVLDCRLAEAPSIEIELPGVNLTISPDTYMRRLPLREGIRVGSAKGVSMTPSGKTQSKEESAEKDTMSVLSVNVTTGPGSSKEIVQAENEDPSSGGDLEHSNDLPTSVTRYCRPKMMPVSLPAPLGPNLFILGEPVLHKYYSVYDWSLPAMGFGLAASHRNLHGPGEDRRGSLPEGVETILMQQSVHVDVDVTSNQGWTDTESDDVMLAQVTIEVIFATPGK